MTRLQLRYEELGLRAHYACMNGDMCAADGYEDVSRQQYRKAIRLDAKATKFKRKIMLAAKRKE